LPDLVLGADDTGEASQAQGNRRDIQPNSCSTTAMGRECRKRSAEGIHQDALTGPPATKAPADREAADARRGNERIVADHRVALPRSRSSCAFI
jgi:hypothetical protein